MSELKELFNEIKSIFVSEGVEVETNSEEFAETTQEVAEVTETKEEKFEDVVLADGTVAQIEPEVVVGAAVVVEVDGELLPAPDGSHELADGRVISTEGGVIVAVEEVEEEEPEVEAESDEEEEMSAPLNEAQEREAKKIIESVVTERVFSIHKNMEDEYNDLQSDLNTLKEGFCKLLDLTEKLLEEPAKDAVKKRSNAFKALQKDTKKDIISVLKSKKIIK